MSSQGVQVGDHNVQRNQFIETYIAQQVVQQPAASAPGPVVAGQVPQLPPAFQPRTELLAALRQSGPGVPVTAPIAVGSALGYSRSACTCPARSRPGCRRPSSWPTPAMPGTTPRSWTPSRPDTGLADGG